MLTFFILIAQMVRDIFISFNDDHIRFIYLYLLNNKTEVLNDFNTYKVEEEKQHEKKMKIVRSDIGNEYYGMYTQKEND
jgi:hypothetical protein